MEQNSNQRRKFQTDGEYSKVPSKFEEIWCPRGGDFPNSRFVRKAKYSSSYSLPLCFESTHSEASGVHWSASGPKMAEKNEREFTEEQLRAHEGHVGLQAGYNKGASQAGVGSFGNTRHM